MSPPGQDVDEAEPGQDSVMLQDTSVTLSQESDVTSASYSADEVKVRERGADVVK